MSFERILMNFNRRSTYANTSQNWIGPEDGSASAQTLRSASVIPYNVLTHKCIKKFGIPYEIADVTNAVISNPRSDGGGVNKWWFEIYDVDSDTLLGTVKDENGASSFVDGSALGAACSGVYIKLVWKSGTVAVQAGDDIVLTTDVDVGGMTALFPAEDITSGEIIYALSSSGSTYYAESTSDQVMRHGGYRHTPTGTDRLPYFDITTAEAALAGAFYVVHIMDSETYDEEVTLGTVTPLVLQADTGQHPVITRGVGARSSRNVSTLFNNANAIYYNENGNDANSGRWQSPMETPAAALAALGGAKVNAVYGGTGATNNPVIYVSAALGPGASENMESEYGRVLTITQGALAHIVTPSGNGATINGISFNLATDSDTYYCINYNFITGTVNDCTVTGGRYGIYMLANGIESVNRCLAINQGYYGIVVACQAGSNISDCIARGGYIGIRLNARNAGAYSVDRCISHDNSNIGFDMVIDAGFATTAVWTRCLSYGNGSNGFNATVNAGSSMGTGSNNISLDNSGWGYNKSGAGASPSLNYSNAYNNTSGATQNVTLNAFNGNDGADATAVDPMLIDPENGYFGIGAESTVSHIVATEIDIGPQFFVVDIAEDDVTINGVEIDGNDQMMTGIKKEGGGDYEGMILKYSKIHGCLGFGVDDYCDAAANQTETDIDNSIITGNGSGVKFWAGSNTVDECLIYLNIQDNTFDERDTAYGHIVNYGAENGFNFNIYSVGSTIINSIASGNSVYGIKTGGISIAPTYCCITDAVSVTVDLSSSTNFADLPLFVNTLIGEEDFHVKTIESGYSIDSPCKDAASDGTDVGAWIVTRSTTDRAWMKYESAFNPKMVQFGLIGKGRRKFENAFGSIDTYAKNFKRRFGINFDSRQPVSRDLRAHFELLSTLVMRRINAINQEQTLFRVRFKPTAKMLSGTATISATNRTITDAAADVVQDEWRGYHATVEYAAGTGTGSITAATKTLTVFPDPGWTPDEWIGKEFPYNGYFFYVVDNTNDDLVLSDPDGVLANAASIDWSIVQHFKIETNDGNGVFTVTDDDGDLPTGSYEWYIDFIQCVLEDVGLDYRQPIYNWDREHSKTGFDLALEES